MCTLVCIPCTKCVCIHLHVCAHTLLEYKELTQVSPIGYFYLLAIQFCAYSLYLEFPGISIPSVLGSLGLFSYSCNSLSLPLQNLHYSHINVLSQIASVQTPLWCIGHKFALLSLPCQFPSLPELCPNQSATKIKKNKCPCLHVSS